MVGGWRRARMDASFWSDIFLQALRISRQWAAEQSRAVAILAALVEFDGRLRLLGPGSPGEPPPSLDAFGIGSGLEHVPSMLKEKHMCSVERLLSALRESAGRFSAHQAALSEVHASVWQRHGAGASSGNPVIMEPAWDVVGAGRGSEAQHVGLPPPSQCIEWIQELDAMYTSELLLKLELIDSIDLSGGMRAEALQGVMELWTLQPHLCPHALDRLRAVAESLTLDPVPGGPV